MNVLSRELTEAIGANILIWLIGTLAWWFIPNEDQRNIALLLLVATSGLVIAAIYIKQMVLSYFRNQSLRQFVRRSAVFHAFVHQARDFCARMLKVADPYTAPPVTADGRALPHPMLQRNVDSIGTMLEEVSRLFEFVAPPDTKIWTSLRDRRSDDRYHTFRRGGRYSPIRETMSEPLHKDKSKTIKELKSSFANGSCVVLTGSTRGPQRWEKQPNDDLKEDLCVLMGAVMTKSWVDGNWGKLKLSWVLSVCADRENAFSEEHVELMKACVDVFATVANVLLRCDPDNPQFATLMPSPPDAGKGGKPSSSNEKPPHSTGDSHSTGALGSTRKKKSKSAAAKQWQSPAASGSKPNA